jgi:hypothetical protein
LQIDVRTSCHTLSLESYNDLGSGFDLANLRSLQKVGLAFYDPSCSANLLKYLLKELVAAQDSRSKVLLTLSVPEFHFHLISHWNTVLNTHLCDLEGVAFRVYAKSASQIALLSVRDPNEQEKQMLKEYLREVWEAKLLRL